jgi:hypothetical protein
MQQNQEHEALNSLVNITEIINERSYASLAKFFDDLLSVYNSKIKTQSEDEPETIEPTYAGIHLNQKYEEEDFLRMIEEFNNQRSLHAKYAIRILKDAIENLSKHSNISYCNFPNARTKLPGVVIVGDLHGSFKDLYYIIKRFGIPGKKYRYAKDYFLRTKKLFFFY